MKELISFHMSQGKIFLYIRWCRSEYWHWTMVFCSAYLVGDKYLYCGSCSYLLSIRFVILNFTIVHRSVGVHVRHATVAYFDVGLVKRYICSMLGGKCLSKIIKNSLWIFVFVFRLNGSLTQIICRLLFRFMLLMLALVLSLLGLLLVRLFSSPSFLMLLEKQKLLLEISFR